MDKAFDCEPSLCFRNHKHQSQRRFEWFHLDHGLKRWVFENEKYLILAFLFFGSSKLLGDAFCLHVSTESIYKQCLRIFSLHPIRDAIPNHGSGALIIQQTCRGSFLAVSKPISASTYSFCINLQW